MEKGTDVRARSRRESNKIATRARILAAAKELFATQGVSGTTVDELAERSQVSRGTFFNYFPTKDAVLTALWADQVDNLAVQVDGLMAQQMSTADRIGQLFAGVVEATERQPGYLKAVTGELEAAFAEPTIVVPRVARFHSILMRVIHGGLAQGDVRVDFEPDFLAQTIAAIFIAVLRTWRTEPAYDLAAGFAEAARFVAVTVCVPPEGG